MTGAGRADECRPKDADGMAEQLGYARGSLAEAEYALATLRERHADLRRQIAAVAAENRQLEHDLLQRLVEWRKLDDGQKVVDDLLPQVRAMTRTMPYRCAFAVQSVVRRLLRLVAPRG